MTDQKICEGLYASPKKYLCPNKHVVSMYMELPFSNNGQNSFFAKAYVCTHCQRTWDDSEVTKKMTVEEIVEELRENITKDLTEIFEEAQKSS